MKATQETARTLRERAQRLRANARLFQPEMADQFFRLADVLEAKADGLEAGSGTVKGDPGLTEYQRRRGFTRSSSLGEYRSWADRL